MIKYSIVHLYLYRNLIKFSQRKKYIDIQDMVYILKRMFHSLPKSFYRDMMQEMQDLGFVKKNDNYIKGIKYTIITDKIKLLEKNKLNDFIFTVQSPTFL